MGILLAFAPFIVFAIVERFFGPVAGLIAAALVSAALLVRDWMGAGRTPKILEVGTFLLFGALALYSVFGNPSWSVIRVRLCVDVGLLLIVLASVAVGRPFTLQYARERVSPEYWASPQFLRTNYIITAAWALAFVVIVLAELALLYVPGVPPRVGIVAIILALVGAVKFTSWYPEHVRAAEKANG
jgi:signal transduction histidine kinase